MSENLKIERVGDKKQNERLIIYFLLMGQQIDGCEKAGLSRYKQSHIEFLCGWGAGLIETCILFPSSKLVFRQQLFGLVTKEAVAQLKNEGLPFLYRGLLPPLIMRTTTRSVMFGMFDTYKKLLNCSDRRGFASTITHKHALAAFLAGTTEATLCPLERIQVLLQNSNYNQKFRNTQEAFYVVRRHGLKEFYRGLSMIIFRNGASNILFFTLREPLRELIFKTGQPVPASATKSDDSSSSSLLIFGANFVSGAILGASISTLFFPINVVKHRLQSTLGTPYQSSFSVFRMVWRERHKSVKELYRGVHLNFTRSLLAWGITNSVYEILLQMFD